MDPEAPGCAAGGVGCWVVLRFRPADCRGAVAVAVAVAVAAGTWAGEREGRAGGEGVARVGVSV